MDWAIIVAVVIWFGCFAICDIRADARRARNRQQQCLRDLEAWYDAHYPTETWEWKR